MIVTDPMRLKMSPGSYTKLKHPTCINNFNLYKPHPRPTHSSVSSQQQQYVSSCLPMQPLHLPLTHQCPRLHTNGYKTHQKQMAKHKCLGDQCISVP